MLFVLRVLRPLRWLRFGLFECREDPVFRDKGVWRKTPLFDRLLTFDMKLPPDGRHSVLTVRPGRAPSGDSTGRHVDALASGRAVPLARKVRATRDCRHCHRRSCGSGTLLDAAVWGCGGDTGAMGNPADATRPMPADMNAWLRDFRKLTSLGRLSVAGLENQRSAVLAVAVTLVTVGV